MAYTYAEFRQKVSEITKDDADKLAPEEKDRFLQEALKLYSKHRPREVVKDITGDATYDYSISTQMTSWVKGFSAIKSIEYPADQREPEMLDDDEWMILEKESGQFIRLLESTPTASEKIRIVYTALHILSDTQNTIPEIDEDAVCNLAASLCSGALASIYAHTSDSTITADSVDHRSKSQEFSSRAKVQKQTYLDHIGLKEGQVLPASARGDIEMTYPDGTTRLTHTKK